MPRPKGCTCGTPKPCKIHPDRATGDPGGRAQDDPTSAAGQDETAGGQAGAEPFLRVIEGKQAKKRPDRPPRPRSRERQKAVDPNKPDDQALVGMLAELLTLPAIPAAMLWDCTYCRDHFVSEGPKAARELVALSLVNPALRGALESLHGAWSKLTIAGVIAGYVAKPMMHHLAPEPVLNAAGPVLGVPPRPPKPKHSHDAPGPQAEHSGSEPEYAGPAPEDQPESDPAAGINAA